MSFRSASDMGTHWSMVCLLFWTLSSAVRPLLLAAESSGGVPSGYPLVYEQKFEHPASLQDFVFTDPAAWRRGSNVTATLELVQQSNYKPSVRSPFNIALIADRVFEDFVLEADLIQTGEEYGHRDMC